MSSLFEEVKNVQDLEEFDNHQAVIRFEEPSVGLKGFIAIHNENLGPATGGTRMFPYASEKDALRDVLRLSRAMTYKCALAGVRHGGGKAVIIGDPEKIKTIGLIRAYAEVINKLKGRFFTGEDVGISEDDVQLMLEKSKFFIGRRGVAGDPSPYAALSTFYAMQTAVEECFGSADLYDHSVAIKGAGKVGGELMRLLIGVGAHVTVADIKPSIIEEIKVKYPQIKIVASEKIYKEKAEIFSPCALGEDLNQKSLPMISARIVCGAANNQLESLEIGDELFKRNIFYVPDYVANAGGLINVVDELEPEGYSRKRVLSRIEHLKNVLKTINLVSRQKNQPTARVADRLAEEIFQNNKHV